MSAEKPEHGAKEIELKLAFEPADAPRILAHPLLAALHAPADKRELISIYYDTGDDALRKAGVFLRVRSTGDGYIQTIKATRDAAEFFERQEWERPVPSHEPELDSAKDTALGPLLSPEVRAGLRPRFHTRFMRKTYQLRRDEAQVELAIDQGEITAGVTAAPISELELELKAGQKRVLFWLARDLAATVPLTLAVKNKAERGFELLDGGPRLVEKARDVDISPDMTCADAFRTIARGCLRQIVVNAPAVHEGCADALHQTRIGIRRFRAGLTLFADVTADDDRDRIAAELKWLTGELGPARDLDVFEADVLGPLRASHPDDAGLAAAYRDFVERRAAAYARAAGAVGSSRFRMALLDIAAWVETAAWAEGALARRPVIEHATEDLSHLRRRLKKRGAHLRELSPAEQHKVRIRAKGLRYATEFFAVTFPGKKNAKRRAKSLAALGDLQDSLGALNDIVIRQSLLAASDAPATEHVPKADAVQAEKHLKDAERAFARFTDIKPFWKA